jgi:short-subunit dehydrogenase
MELRGAIGILTGASRGIGVYLAEHFARAGVDLALAARSAGGLEETAARVKAVGTRAEVIPTDLRKRSDLERLVAQAEERLGSVDLLINNAGIEHYAHFEEIDPDVIEAVLTTNLLGVELLTRFVLPGMIARRRGHIVNVSSVAGKTAMPYNTVYSSSKAGLISFSWSLREELRRYNVGVSVVCPSFVSESGMFASWSRGRKAPGIARAVSPERVASATVKAVERNRSEVVIARGLARISDVAAAISPEISGRIARRTGLFDYLEKNTRSRTD